MSQVRSAKICPLCSRLLSLKQISFTTAVYICDSIKCPYPVGYQCIVIERQLKDMNKAPVEGSTSELDDWINNIISSDVEKPNVSNTIGTHEDFDDILKMLSE